MQIHIQCMWIVYMYECMFTFIDTCKDRKRGTNRKNTCCQGKLFPLLCLCRWAQNSKRKPSQYQLDWSREKQVYLERGILLCCKRSFSMLQEKYYFWSSSTSQEEPGAQAHRLLPPPWPGLSWQRRKKGWNCGKFHNEHGRYLMMNFS